jgi:hypothetical protein
LFLVRDFATSAHEVGLVDAKGELLPLLVELASDVEPGMGFQSTILTLYEK